MKRRKEVFSKLSTILLNERGCDDGEIAAQCIYSSFLHYHSKLILTCIAKRIKLNERH